MHISSHALLTNKVSVVGPHVVLVSLLLLHLQLFDCFRRVEERSHAQPCEIEECEKFKQKVTFFDTRTYKLKNFLT